MRSHQFLLTCALFSLLGCAHQNAAQETFDPPYPELNRTGDPIVAVFAGRIPCAVPGCEKLKVELVLYGRDAGRIPTTYWLGQVGIGNERRVQQGTWTTYRGLQNYPNGLVYQVDTSADPSLQNFWRVSDDIILVLDWNLRPKVGNAAWGFMLSRDCSPYGPKSYPYDEHTKRFVASAEVSNCAPGE